MTNNSNNNNFANTKVPDVIKVLCGKLEDYLRDQSRIIGKHVRCIYGENHKNGDAHPSASIVPNNKELCHCHGCGKTFDIFKAVHILEKLPISGPEFWTKTVATLAKRYKIEYNPSLIDDDTKEYYHLRKLNEDITEYIVNNTPDDIYKYAAKRQWSRELCKELQIGGIPSYTALKKYLKELGWTEDIMSKAGVYQSNPMFQEDNLIFSIRDTYGRASGFVARYIKFSKKNDRQSRAKYTNSRDSAIYKKDRILYGFYLSRKDPSQPLYIVEGYGDFVTLYNIGVKNVAALGGVALTGYHVNAIEKAGFKKVIIMLDGDEAGKQNMVSAIDRFKGKSDLDVYAITLPDGQDPDDYFLDKTPEDLYNYETVELIHYYIDYLLEQDDSEKTLDHIANYISSYNSGLTRKRLIDRINDLYNIDVETLKLAVEDKLNTIQFKTSQETESLKNEFRKKIMDPRTNIIDLVNDMSYRIESMNTSRIEIPKTAFDEAMEVFNKTYERFNMAGGSLIVPLHYTEIDDDGIEETFGIPSMSEALDGGIPLKAFWLSIAGGSHSGKSILMRNMALHILRNDASVLYFSLDEGTSTTTNALVSSLSNYPFTIVENIDALDRYRINNSRLEEMKLKYSDVKEIVHSDIEIAYSELRNLIEAKKLFIIGKNRRSIPDIKNAIEEFRYENSKMVTFIDSFQALAGGDGEMSSQFQRIACSILELKDHLDIAIITSSELNKVASNREPVEGDISETRKVAFNSDVLMLIHNEYKTSQGDSQTKNLIETVDKTGNIYLDVFNKSWKVQKVRHIFTKSRRGAQVGTSYYVKHIPWSLTLEECTADENRNMNNQRNNNLNLSSGYSSKSDSGSTTYKPRLKVKVKSKTKDKDIQDD